MVLGFRGLRAAAADGAAQQVRATGPQVERPALYPAEERGGGLVGASSPLGKVTGVTEGYLGAGNRRSLAP